MNLTIHRILIPLGLGVAAAVLNFLVLRGAVAPIHLAAVSQDVKPGTPLTERLLTRVAIRADAKLFTSAVPYSQRSVLYDRPVRRAMLAGEVVLRADVDEEFAESWRSLLQPGEFTLALHFREECVTPGLLPGDRLRFLLRRGVRQDTDDQQWLGPFRLIGSTVTFKAGREAGRQLVLAIPLGETSHVRLVDGHGGDNVLRVEREHSLGTKTAPR